MLLIEDLRNEFARLRALGRVTNGTIELIGESFLASSPSVFGAPNQEYIERELAWYKSGSLNVNDIPGGSPKIWKQVASPSGEINSNYGFLMMDEANGMQLENVMSHLINDPETRRATAVYTRPSIHEDWNRDGMQDFICTNAVQYLIRDNKLHLVVQMRSNDIVFGYRNDWAWHKYTQQLVLDALTWADMDVEAGEIVWHAASLHMYERHFWILDHYVETGDPLPEVTK